MLNLLNFILLVSFGVANDYGHYDAFICNLVNENSYNLAFIGNGEYALEYDFAFYIETDSGINFNARPIEDDMTTIYDGTLENINVFDFAIPTGFYTNAENLELIDIMGDYAIYNLDLQVIIYLNNDYADLVFYTTLYIELDISNNSQYFDALAVATYNYWSSDIEVDYYNVVVDSYDNGYSVGYGSGYSQGEQDGFNNGYIQGYEQGVEDSGVINLSWVDWLVNAVGGFFDFELFPNFTLGQVFGSIVTIFIALWLLKVMAGG